MKTVLCPHCYSDDIEHIETSMDTGDDEYFCSDCGEYFIIDLSTIDTFEENKNSYPEEYYEEYDFDSDSDGEDDEDY